MKWLTIRKHACANTAHRKLGWLGTENKKEEGTAESRSIQSLMPTCFIHMVYSFTNFYAYLLTLDPQSVLHSLVYSCIWML